mgnify:CR=1 FL=1
MEDTKLDQAMEETAEQSFNDSELKDIMSEIESLENHWQFMESEIAGWHICAEEL